MGGVRGRRAILSTPMFVPLNAEWDARSRDGTAVRARGAVSSVEIDKSRFATYHTPKTKKKPTRNLPSMPTSAAGVATIDHVMTIAMHAGSDGTLVAHNDRAPRHTFVRLFHRRIGVLIAIVPMWWPSDVRFGILSRPRAGDNSHILVSGDTNRAPTTKNAINKCRIAPLVGLEDSVFVGFKPSECDDLPPLKTSDSIYAESFRQTMFGSTELADYKHCCEWDWRQHDEDHAKGYKVVPFDGVIKGWEKRPRQWGLSLPEMKPSSFLRLSFLSEKAARAAQAVFNFMMFPAVPRIAIHNKDAFMVLCYTFMTSFSAIRMDAEDADRMFNEKWTAYTDRDSRKCHFFARLDSKSWRCRRITTQQSAFHVLLGLGFKDKAVVPSAFFLNPDSPMDVRVRMRHDRLADRFLKPCTLARMRAHLPDIKEYYQAGGAVSGITGREIPPPPPNTRPEKRQKASNSQID